MQGKIENFGENYVIIVIIIIFLISECSHGCGLQFLSFKRLLSHTVTFYFYEGSFCDLSTVNSNI